MTTLHDLTDRIERVPETERHFGVALESLSAFLAVNNDGDAGLMIAGEVVGLGRQTIFRDVTILASAHDAMGCVMAVAKDNIGAHGFYEIQAFSMDEYSALLNPAIAKIKIYPCGY